jgi:uncharacterized protein (TIGR02466 family)
MSDEYPPNGGISSLQVSQIFPTLFGRIRIPNSEARNAQLMQRILEWQSTTPSEDFANSGGWHSPSDLLEKPGEDIVWLRGIFSAGINAMVKSTLQLPEAHSRAAALHGGFQVVAWANVSHRGNYHRMHNHPGSAWSGCYYVHGTSDTNSLAGTLELYDPRPFTEMVDVPGKPYGQRLVIRPEPGLLILFPGWLYHFVHPVDSDEPRVSIAFNSIWKTA